MQLKNQLMLSAASLFAHLLHPSLATDYMGRRIYVPLSHGNTQLSEILMVTKISVVRVCTHNHVNSRKLILRRLIKKKIN